MQAYIGGTVSMSTVDWPKNICTAIFFAGCDFNCPFCQNSDLIPFKEDFLKDIKEIKKEILKNLDFIDAILFSGGEASLQRLPLIELGSYAKKLGLKVGLETNGTKPDVISQLIEKEILDFVGLDIKAPMTNAKLFEKATKASTFFKSTQEVIDNLYLTLSILKENQDKVEIELRTTIVPRLVYRKEDILDIANIINDLKIDARWSLQQFRSDFGNVLDPMYKDLENPKKKFLEQLKEECLKHYPNLRIDVKAI